MRERLGTDRKDLDNRRSYWVYVFARLKPGVTLADAAAAINVPYTALINDVEAGLQTGMSEATMGQFRAKRIRSSRARAARASLAATSAAR